MANFFEENFSDTGSTDIDGRTPDTVSYGSAAWELTSGILDVIDGYLENTIGYNSGARIGDGTSNYGLPQSFTLTFVFKTGPSVAAGAPTMTHFWMTPDSSGNAFITRLESTSSGTWTLYFDDQYTTSGGVSVSVAADTEYTGTITHRFGLDSKLIFMGQTLTRSAAANNNNTGFNGVAVILGDTTKLGLVSAASLASSGASISMPKATALGYGSYFGSVAMPSAAAMGFSGARGAIVMPPASVSATGRSIAVGASISSPSAVVSGYGGSAGAVTFPAAIVAGRGAGQGNAAMPMFRIDASGHDSTGERAAYVVMPAFGLIGRGGGAGTIAMPSATVLSIGRVTNIGFGGLVMPSAAVTSMGMVSSGGSASVRLPSVEMVGNSGGVISMTMGDVTVSAIGRVSNMGRAQVTLPLFDVVANGSVRGLNSAALVMPALKATNSGRAYIVAPGFQLAVIGTAVVVASYEAYAVNLRPSNESGINETTRYTNFPFTHIVRYQGRCYGAAADGLYLLDGATDHATPTPAAIRWSWKTTVTDFDTALEKTVVSAYFGGSLGRSETVTLYAGAKSSEAYRYTTPRGDDIQNHRQKFGRGIKARYYALGAQGAGPLALDTVEFNINTLTRRI